MVALQDTAFSMIIPGAKCSDVDRAVREYFEENDLMSYWKHPIGHAIGLRYHETPFLDLGDETAIKPGMVFTVEPGLYVPELGGLSHSDTVVVTEDGNEILTYYPRDLDSLTIPVWQFLCIGARSFQLNPCSLLFNLSIYEKGQWYVY